MRGTPSRSGSRECAHEKMPGSHAPPGIATKASRLLGGGLFGDDQVLDFRVGGLGNDLLASQIGFLDVGPSVDNFLRIRRTDARQRGELIFRGGVDVYQVSGRCGGGRRGGFGGLRWWPRESGGDAHSQNRQGQNYARKLLVHRSSPQN